MNRDKPEDFVGHFCAQHELLLLLTDGGYVPWPNLQPELGYLVNASRVVVVPVDLLELQLVQCSLQYDVAKLEEMNSPLDLWPSLQI